VRRAGLKRRRFEKEKKERRDSLFLSAACLAPVAARIYEIEIRIPATRVQSQFFPDSSSRPSIPPRVRNRKQNGYCQSRYSAGIVGRERERCSDGDICFLTISRRLLAGFQCRSMISRAPPSQIKTTLADADQGPQRVNWISLRNVSIFSVPSVLSCFVCANKISMAGRPLRARSGG
jgi:hypothetical protein